MHWEEAALSKGIWHAEKRCPAEVFVKPKNKQREATNLLHVYIIEAALQAERQLPEALPIKTTTLTCHTHSYASVNYVSQPFHLQQFQEFRTRYLYVKKKKMKWSFFKKQGNCRGPLWWSGSHSFDAFSCHLYLILRKDWVNTLVLHQWQKKKKMKSIWVGNVKY